MADSLLDGLDWRGSWVELQAERMKPKGSEKWDARSASFARREGSGYSETFVDYMALAPGESVFDMGCGTGEIAAEIAKRDGGHDVVAADFSQGMLGHLRKRIADEGLEGRVRPVLMSWDDDWASCGVAPKSVDVAIASRSIMVPDLGEAIDKLIAVARRRVCITLGTGGTPSEDLDLNRAIGRDTPSVYDVPYAFNILYQMGYVPDIRHIPHGKRYVYTTLDEAVDDRLSRMDGVTDEERALAEAFIGRHLVPASAEGEEGMLEYRPDSTFVWAFISWDLR